MKHLELDLTIDFETRTLHGSVVHHLDPPEGPTFAVRLHTRDLDIESVTAGTGDGPRQDVDWGLQPHDEVEGRTLLAQVPEGCDRLEVRYRSRPQAAGLQWLEPSQTAGGEHPYLYSQGQSIHNRTWIPCFDDPAARITFDAVLRIPAGLRAVMAAEDRTVESEAAQGVFRFHMPQPVPSYLIAMAVGNLVFREMGPRTGVWTEPEMLEKAWGELQDTEKMIEAVESMFGEYRWGRYDVLVLPPSFPLGGMENPRLTFATPTILAGDKSLVALIAHELAHSWSGNLVTNETWNDFWLNEGFTVYLERRIQEKLYGPARAEMEASIGRSRLEDTLKELGPQSRDTWLYLDMEGRHPDDAMTDVPYEKGYLLLRLVEQTYGRERFDRFLRGYFDRFAFETMTTERFLHHLKEDLLEEDAAKAEKIRLDDWVFGPGIPDNAPRAQSDAFARVEDAAKAWVTGTAVPASDTVKAWTAHEWIHFLRELPRDLDAGRLGELDAAFSLTASHNSEILCEWLKLAVRTGYEAANARLEEFLCEVGRRKFVKPLFEELVRTPAGVARAREIYARSRKTYHSMTSNTVDEILAEASA